jgi:hypothetical protein
VFALKKKKIQIARIKSSMTQGNVSKKRERLNYHALTRKAIKAQSNY